MSDPVTTDEFIRRAVTRYRQGDLAGALADFEEAARREPNRPDLHNNCGVLLRARGDVDGALAAFSAALRCNPQFAEGYNNRGVLRLVRGDVAGAREDFEEAIRLVPNYADALSNRGVLRRDAGDLEGAVADFETVLRLRPDNLEAIRQLAIVHREKRDFAGALANLDRALARAPREAAAPLYVDRALVRLQQGDWPGTVAECDRALALNPRSVDAYLYRGNARYHAGDPTANTDHLRAHAIDGPGWAVRVIEIIAGDLRRGHQEFFDQCNRFLSANASDVVAQMRRGLGLLLLNRPAEAARDLALLHSGYEGMEELLTRAVAEYLSRPGRG